MARWDGSLEYLMGERPGLWRLGRLMLIALVIWGIAIGVSFALGDSDQADPVKDDATGRYAEGPTNWALCAAFVVMGAVLLAAVGMEIRS
jgi:hypothetical protein